MYHFVSTSIRASEDSQRGKKAVNPVLLGVSMEHCFGTRDNALLCRSGWVSLDSSGFRSFLGLVNFAFDSERVNSQIQGQGVCVQMTTKLFTTYTGQDFIPGREPFFHWKFFTTNFFPNICRRSTDDVRIRSSMVNPVNILFYKGKRFNSFPPRYFAVLRRRNYVTPTSYLELIKTFKSLLGQKRLQILTMKNRYLVGLDKLNFAASQVQNYEFKWRQFVSCLSFLIHPLSFSLSLSLPSLPITATARKRTNERTNE